MIKIADKILEISNKDNEKFLRSETEEFDFAKYTKAEVRDLVRRMRLS